MKYSTYLVRAIFASLCISGVNAVAAPVKFKFFQDGFYSYEFNNDGDLIQGSLTNAFISGSFIGEDRDGDGQIYARGQLAVDFGYGPFGNELISADVTFNGFGTSAGPQTIVYDSNGVDAFGGKSDMTSLFSAFMGIAYNLDGGPLGDTPDEGLSLSLFAPSTNFSVGSAFAAYWNDPDYFSSEITGICNSFTLCGLVFEALPAQTPSGAAATTPFFLSSNAFQIEQVAVSEPSLLSLFAGALGGLFLVRRKRNYKVKKQAQKYSPQCLLANNA